MKKYILKSSNFLFSQIVIPLFLISFIIVCYLIEKMTVLQLSLAIILLIIYIAFTQKYCATAFLYKKHFIVHWMYPNNKRKFLYADIEKIFQISAIFNPMICIVLKNKRIFDRYIFVNPPTKYYTPLDVLRETVSHDPRSEMFKILQKKVKKYGVSKQRVPVENKE